LKAGLLWFAEESIEVVWWGKLIIRLDVGLLCEWATFELLLNTKQTSSNQLRVRRRFAFVITVKASVVDEGSAMIRSLRLRSTAMSAWSLVLVVLMWFTDPSHGWEATFCGCRSYTGTILKS